MQRMERKVREERSEPRQGKVEKGKGDAGKESEREVKGQRLEGVNHLPFKIQVESWERGTRVREVVKYDIEVTV